MFSNFKTSIRPENQTNLSRKYLEQKYQSLSTITFLDLSKQNWQTIKADAFISLNKLEKLCLHNNQIETLEPKLFEDLSNLKHLHLYGNKLNRINI